MEENRPIADGSVPDRWEDKPILKEYITKEQIMEVGVRKNAAAVFIPIINKYANKYKLTQKEFNAFLAQVLHESGGFSYTREIWGNTKWQKAYEGNKALGNTQEGDGKFFMGRGLIGITGRKNYAACSKDIFWDDRLLRMPQLLETPEYATASAFWYCFDYAKLRDEFETDGIADETRLINGRKMLGFNDRLQLLNKINSVTKTS